MSTKFWTCVEKNLKNKKVSGRKIQLLLGDIEKEFFNYFEKLFPSSIAIIAYENTKKNEALKPEEIDIPLIHLIKSAYPKKSSANRDQRIIDTMTNFGDLARTKIAYNTLDEIQNSILSGINVINSINALHNQINLAEETRKKIASGNSELDNNELEAVKVSITGLVDELVISLKKSGIFNQEKTVKTSFEKLIDLFKKLIGIYVEPKAVEAISKNAHNPGDKYDPSKASSSIQFNQ